MRKILTILISTLVLLSGATAQELRIGRRIPPIDVDSSAGSDLKLVEKEFTCLIFMHSESEPSIEAIRKFSTMTLDLREKLDIVLLTMEQDGFEQEMLNSFTTANTIVAFDNDGRTFRNFDVSYIPFAVVYHSRSRRALWFGSLAQLQNKEIRMIIK